MLCSEVMKQNPACISEDDTAQAAARRMRDENIGFLPVCDADGKPLGAVTDRDLAMRILADQKGADSAVRDCMTRDVVCCKASDDIVRAEQLMGQNRKSRIMVVDDQERLIGVISLSDIAVRDSRRAARTMREVAQREVRA